MKFKILELHKDTIPHLTASFSDLVSNVRYSLTEVVGNTDTRCRICTTYEFLQLGLFFFY